MNKKFTKLMAALALLVFMTPSMAGWGQTRTDYEAVITFDCASASANGNSTIYGGSASTSMDPTHIKAFLNNAAGSTVINSNPSSYSSVYWAKGSGGSGIPDDVLKIGTASGSGNCTFTIADSFDEISKVSITGYGWKNTTKVAVNGSATQSPSAAATEVTFDYVLSEPTRTIAINITTSAFCATEIVLYKEATSSVYTVTYDCNGGESNCPSNLTDIEPGTSITLASAPTKPHYNFIGWKNGGTTYDAGASYTVNSNVTFIAQWEPDGTYGEGSICFSNQSSCTAINSQSVTGEDDLGNTWTITTVGTNSFTSNSGYYQVGSSSSPATSITFTTTLDEEVNATSFSAMFGGFSTTRASVVLKVDDTQVGSGTLNGASDVTVSSPSAQIGTTLTVIVTPTAGGVKCYNISYTYETIDNPAVATTTTINVPANFNTDIYQGATAGTLTATVKDNENNTISGATVTWSSSNTGVATINANGEVTLVAVGTTTITASFAGVVDEYKPSEGTYEFTVTDSNAPGTENNPYTVAQAIAATPSSGTSDNVYIHGIVSRFHNNSIVGDGTNYRYYISDDGTTSTELLVYKGKGLNHETFSDANDLLIGDEVTICGGLTTYNNTKEIAADNFIVSLVRPAQYTLTAAMTNVAEYSVFVGDDEIEFDENNQAQVRAGATVGVSIATMEDCFIFGSLTVNGSSEGVTQEDPNDPYFTFEMPEGNATIDVTSSAATQHTLTVVGLNNVTYTEMHAGIGSEEVILTNNQATLCEGINVDIVGLTANTGLLLQSVTLNYGTTTTTLELDYGIYHFNMPSSDATLTFTTTTAPTYTLASSIESGKTYIIVNQESSKAMGVQKDTNRDAVNVAIANDKITVSSDDVYEFFIESVGENVYSIYDARYNNNSGGYLYAASGSKNHLKTEEELDADGNGKWTISIGENDGVSIVAQGSNSRKYMRFNANNGNPIFSCYASTSNLPQVSLYVKDETPATESYELTINGYGSSTTGGWNLIASPVSTTPVQVTNMLTEETTAPYSYDLYRFNQAAESEWENYHQHSGDFNIVPGTGYLYANKGDVNNTPNSVTLTFTGVPYSGDGEIELVYSTANSDSKMHGWNLIGNPFSTAATLNLPFFKMNGTGSGFTSQNANSSVAAMEGVLVYAYDDGASQPISTATFTAAGRSNSESAAMVNIDVVSSFGDVMDNAIVNFNEGIQLPKFYFGTQNANIYIPQGNKEYAVVSTEAQGEMPVNFKAAENGTYTLTVNPEGVEMNYLHLIDNMTGADIDLLAATSTGSVATYTFNARTTDYSSRFRLVFAANNEDGVSTGSTAFAFYSNGTWVINNTGEATLQVVDVNGRILSSETVNGSVSKAINAPAGVYMLRLINGNDVKTQKIVVR